VMVLLFLFISSFGLLGKRRGTRLATGLLVAMAAAGIAFRLASA